MLERSERLDKFGSQKSTLNFNGVDPKIFFCKTTGFGIDVENKYTTLIH